MKIFNVLSDGQIKAIYSAAAKTSWVDGEKTASGPAKSKKLNLQITHDDPVFKAEILPMIRDIHVSDEVSTYTHITNLLSPRLARYSGGGHYDWHVDRAVMQRVRTDLSFTIFLSDKDAYEGGELEFQQAGGSVVSVKGHAGSMVVYPSGMLHRVKPVTSGERTVIVGWLKSGVRSQQHREQLFELLAEISRLQKKFGSSEVEALTKLYHQFLRDYSD
jgi:PKHD-type hydroxylase